MHTAGVHALLTGFIDYLLLLHLSRLSSSIAGQGSGQHVPCFESDPCYCYYSAVALE